MLLKAGATLTNTGTSTGTSWKQFVNITLDGDAYVDSNKNIGLLAGGHGATTLTLDGHKLTKKGNGTFYMINTTVDAGTIDIQGGTVQVGCNEGTKQTDASSTIFSLSGGHLTVNGGDTLKLSSLTGTSALSRVNGSGTMHILGSGDASTSAMLEGALNVVVNKDSGTQTIGMDTVWTGGLTLTKGTLKLNMASGATLDDSKITRTITNGKLNSSLVLTGAGTYTITGVNKEMGHMGVSVGDGWTGKTVITNSHIAGSTLNSFAKQGTTLKLVGYSGWMQHTAPNILCDIELENYSNTVDGVTTTKSAFVFDDSSQDKHYKFQGKVSGSGDFQMATCANASSNIHFTGDTSEWTGGIIITNALETADESKRNNTATMTINLTGGGNIFSADGNKGFVMDRASTNDGDNIINLNIGHSTNASTMNGAISMGENAGESSQLNLAVKGDTTFKKEVGVTSLTVDANKTATLEATATTNTLTTNGTVELTEAGSLTYGGTTSVSGYDISQYTETTGATITNDAITGGTVSFYSDASVTESRTISNATIMNGGTGTANVKVGDQNVTVYAYLGNIEMTAANGSTSVAQMTIAAGSQVSATGDLTVTSSLYIASTEALSVTGALVLTGATVDLSGFTVNTTTAQQEYVYTLGTAKGGITRDEKISFTGLTVEGYNIDITTMPVTSESGIAMAAEGVTTALVLKLTAQTTVDALTSLTVNGLVGYANGVLTLKTEEAALGAVFDSQKDVNVTMSDADWDAILATLKVEGTTLPSEIALKFQGSDGKYFDFNGTAVTDDSGMPAITINKEIVRGEYTGPNDGTITGNYVTAYIPEPTTTTLSLLALAGLAVRRRRASR